MLCYFFFFFSTMMLIKYFITHYKFYMRMFSHYPHSFSEKLCYFQMILYYFFTYQLFLNNSKFQQLHLSHIASTYKSHTSPTIQNLISCHIKSVWTLQTPLELNIHLNYLWSNTKPYHILQHLNNPKTAHLSEASSTSTPIFLKRLWNKVLWNKHK